MPLHGGGQLRTRAIGTGRFSEVNPLFVVGRASGLRPLDSPLHGRPRDAEQVAELGAALFAGLQQGDHVGFLQWVQFGLFAP
jgi:hypothetical protein